MTALAQERTTITPPPVGSPWRDWFLREIAPLRTAAVQASSEYRRRVTRDSPLRFAIVYMPKEYLLLPDHTDMSFSELHLDLAASAKAWRKPGGQRNAWVAPRGAGKSVWLHMILPLWALAHGHRTYAFTFSYNHQQAKLHLSHLRRQLDENELLLQDYDVLRPVRGRGTSNTSATVMTRGATIMSRGLGEAALGARSAAERAGLIVIDDAEPVEEDHSPALKESILRKVLAGVLPMGGADTIVQLTGTVTAYQSVLHDVVRTAKGEPTEWVVENGFTPHVWPGVLVDRETGAERSLWPQRWALTDTHFGEYLRGSRSYALNVEMDPRADSGRGGTYWTPDLFRYEPVERFHAAEYVLAIDPALKTGSKNDLTAMTVVGRSADRRRAIVVHAVHARLTGEQIRSRIHDLAERNPGLRTLIVEENAGGSEHWAKVLEPRGMPLPEQFGRAGNRVTWEWVSGSKSSRAQRALAHYERGQVVHARRFADLEDQLVRFPDPRQHDDLVDSTGAALRWAFNER